MKVPYYIQGALFAPALVGVLFILKITCPAGAGQGCFSDPFLTPVFMPLTFIYKVFGNSPFVVSHEPMFILLYWILIGLFVGMLFDILNHKKQEFI
jgi:hypothetical protein